MSISSRIEKSIDRSAFSVTSKNDSDEKEFWLRQTPEARINHIETLRKINYGDATSERLQRVFEVVQLKRG